MTLLMDGAFTRDGYAIASIFDPSEILTLQREISAHIDRVTRALWLPYEETHPEASFADRIERIAVRDPSYAHLLGAAVCTDAHRMPAFQAIANDRRLRLAAEDILGGPVGEMTVRIRGNSSAMGEHRHDWHSDVARADGGACSTIKLTAWLPLVDAGPANGGLEVAAARLDQPLTHEQGKGRFAIPEAAVADMPKVAIACPMGSCLFLDRYTPHRAVPNTSGQTRWSLVMWMKSGVVH